MSAATSLWASNLGRHLYALLPAEYRVRDNNQRNNDGRVIALGDLANYCDSCGVLLDGVDHLLQQLDSDRLPGVVSDVLNNGPDALSCQPWILPYIAQLLDVRLVSSATNGQRSEIANAVSWRKSKGTAKVAEQVSESIASLEVEQQEGWQQVAVTPRASGVGTPLLPAATFGAPEPDPNQPEKHPGLKITTVDFRQHSRAIQADPQYRAASKRSNFGDAEQSSDWLQANPHGTPCFVGSYQDVAQRSVDMRESNWRIGHYHPKRLLLRYLPEPGFFPDTLIGFSWANLNQHPDQIEITHTEKQTIIRGLTNTPVRITGTHALANGTHTVFENVCIDNALTIEAGSRATFIRSAVKTIHADSAELHKSEQPIITAEHCLFERMFAEDGMVTLSYCTLLGDVVAEIAQASDCIFAGQLRRTVAVQPAPLEQQLPNQGCVRFSALMPVYAKAETIIYRKSCAFTTPLFFADQYKHRGAGVLHPACNLAITAGAENGGEMGAYYHRRYCLNRQAALDKLSDFLPLGITAILIPDHTLLCQPAQAV